MDERKAIRPHIVGNNSRPKASVSYFPQKINGLLSHVRGFSSNIPLTAADYIPVMRYLPTIMVLVVFFFPADSFAGSFDAREVARINNCTPKKIEVYQQTLGMTGDTVYRVSCNLPKTKNESAAKGADAVLISCTGGLCEYLRAISADNK